MPPTDIDRLIGWTTIYPTFKEDLLNPEKRLGALNQFQQPDKNNPMFGIDAKPEGGNLTPIQIEALMSIKAKDMDGFSKRCVEMGLASRKEQSHSPESNR